MANFSINDLSELSGLKKHTIRVWEQRYSFLKPLRSQSQHRSYTAEELGVLLDAALLNQHGYRISLINKMSDEKKMLVFSRIASRQQKAMHDLIIHMAKMDVAAFDAVLEQAIQTWGIFETLQQVLIPFCEKVGLLEGTYNKNYIENILLIRQSIVHKFLCGIGQAKSEVPSGKTMLLFFAGPAAELPLLYLQYQLTLQGYKLLNLGQPLSVEHLAAVSKLIGPEWIVGYMGKGSSGLRNLDLFVEGLGADEKINFVSLGQPVCLDVENPYYSFFPNAGKFLEAMAAKDLAY